MSDYAVRKRLNVYLALDHVKKLREASITKGVSKSAIVAAALGSFLSVEESDRREAIIAKRLDRLARQFERLERDQTILIEALALYIRYQLSVLPPPPDSHQEAIRAQSKVRFAKFIEQLGRHLQRGNSLVKEVSRERNTVEQPSANSADISGDSKLSHEVNAS